MHRSEIERLSVNLSEIIQRYVRASGYANLFSEADRIQLKIDLLERTLEILRIQRKCLENNLPMEDFVQSKIEIDGDVLHFLAPDRRKRMESGTTPIRLQPKLLLFLLFRHRRGYYKVYDIIDDFIKTVWDHLKLLDFKKTQTGVTRCFTNTRFAANTLREYGLLKFTQREAYKTWVLSLSGVLVASKLMENVNWSIPEVEKKSPFDLHSDIRNAFGDLKTYDSFVKRLTSLCKPSTRAFEDFKEASGRAYSLLGRYWSVLQDASLSKAERKEKSLILFKQIEEDPGIMEFYDRFCESLNVGDLPSLEGRR